MLSLDLSFYNWELFTGYILKGLLFSVQLTVIATIGGIVVGTFLALMRLSGRPALVYPATIYVNTMRSIPLVMVILWFFLLIPMLIGKPIGADLSATLTFIAFEAAFFSSVFFDIDNNLLKRANSIAFFSPTFNPICSATLIFFYFF